MVPASYSSSMISMRSHLRAGTARSSCSTACAHAKEHPPGSVSIAGYRTVLHYRGFQQCPTRLLGKLHSGVQHPLHWSTVTPTEHDAPCRLLTTSCVGSAKPLPSPFPSRHIVQQTNTACRPSCSTHPMTWQ
jgi:hypothetical protein